MNKKIFDTFLYYDEDMLLEIRLKYLYNHVDFFFIIECDHDFNFNKKSFNFKIENFSKYKNKIVYIKYEAKNLNNKNNFNWYIHDHIRDKLFNKVQAYSGENDIIIHGDLDEFPNSRYFKYFKKINNNDKKIYCLKLKNFFFKFNLLDNNHYVLKTKITLFKNIKSFSNLRDLKGKEYKWWRIDNYFKKKKSNKIKILKYGGWHFTWIKSNADIIKKFKSVIEFKNKNTITECYIKNKIRQKKNFVHEIYGFESNLKLINIETEFPKKLVEIIRNYDEFIEIENDK